MKAANIASLESEWADRYPWSAGEPCAPHAWEDVTEAAHTDEAVFLDDQLARLGEDADVAAGIYRTLLLRRQRELRWLIHAFPVNHMLGIPNQRAGGLRIPFYLQSRVPLRNIADAERHIALVLASGPHLQALAARIALGAAGGIVLPEHSRLSCLREIDGMAATGGGILTDFEHRIGSAGIDEAKRAALATRVADAVSLAFLPGLAAVRDAVAGMGASLGDGVWALPDGDAFYRHALDLWTSEEADPEALHAEAQEAVRSLYAEVRDQAGTLGYDRDRLGAALTGADAYFANDDHGRADCLARARSLVEAAGERLVNVLGRAPSIPLEVRQVEPERSASAVFGEYYPPSGQGVPGVYCLNLADLTQIPRREVAALSFHEGYPGHHAQIGLAFADQRLHAFQRRPFLFEGFAEGWAMYAEALGCEILADQLDAEDMLGLKLRQLWMAARVVADTGLHAMRWPRERARAWLSEHSFASPSLIAAEVERYIVWPGQACAYHVGRSTLQELRRRTLGPEPSSSALRDFHATVLADGGMPLALLRARFDSAA